VPKEIRSNVVPRDNRQKTAVSFVEATPVLSAEHVIDTMDRSLARWHAQDKAEAERRAAVIAQEFPDEYNPDVYWNAAANHSFRDFFSWGHDQDFGFGAVRGGAMGQRHIEIISECLEGGFFPADLSGAKVLDVGCWSGGDILALSGLGGKVTAIEEHPKSAASARRLCELVGCEAEINVGSVYKDRQDWVQQFDLVYASGVIYHVTDPLLFIRILFAYLKPGGTLVLETKASPQEDSSCGYSGTLDLGWNWFAPTREALGRWLVDAGFEPEDVKLKVRTNGRLLSAATKRAAKALPETAGFSRPDSWLEGKV